MNIMNGNEVIEWLSSLENNQKKIAQRVITSLWDILCSVKLNNKYNKIILETAKTTDPVKLVVLYKYHNHSYQEAAKNWLWCYQNNIPLDRESVGLYLQSKINYVQKELEEIL